MNYHDDATGRGKARKNARADIDEALETEGAARGLPGVTRPLRDHQNGGNAFIEDGEREIAQAESDASNRDVRLYSLSSIWDIACTDYPIPDELWNGIKLLPFAVYGVAGAPSIGKSRIIDDLARSQALGRDFLGLPTLKKKLKWVVLCSENDKSRRSKEQCHFFFGRTPGEMLGMSRAERRELALRRGFTEEELRRADELIKVSTLEQPEDCDISLADEQNCQKLTATLAQERPDIVVFDPWGDMVIGKELDDGDVRETVRVMRQCLRKARVSASCFIICHARMGIAEEAKAGGTEGGNFMKNSKCLYSIARYFINVRRASLEENPPVELICSKNSNGPKPPPVAAKLNPQTMSYEPLEDYDPVAWQAEIEAAARSGAGKYGGRGVSPKLRDAEIREEIRAALDNARSEARSNGKQFRGIPKGKLTELVQAAFARKDAKVTDKQVRVALTGLAEQDPEAVAISEPFDSRREYVGTPDEIAWVKEDKRKARK